MVKEEGLTNIVSTKDGEQVGGREKKRRSMHNYCRGFLDGGGSKGSRDESGSK